MAKGVYWVGNDGNIWTKVEGIGIRNEGSASGLQLKNNGFGNVTVNGGGFTKLDRIDNPSGPAKTSNNDTTLGGGGGGGSQYTDTTAARNSIQSQLDSLGRQLANLNKSAKDEYDALMEAYTAENEANQKNYEGQIEKNEATRSGGISQSLSAAAQGGRGLRAALSAMGALGGTGSLLANRAIASSANNDIGGVNETFETNATNLNSAWEQTEREQRQRNTDAKTALKNARTKNAGSIASQRQGLFRDMAGFWEQAGNNTEAANWLSKMGSQNAAIEAASKAATPSFQRASAKFSPQALKNYLAGNMDMSVQTQPNANGTTMNSPIYATSQRREEYA